MSSKTAKAYRQLKLLIQGGHVPFGERLTEARAAELLGMSRSPVRESLVRLEAEGLLEHRGSRQSRVVVYAEDQNPREILHRYELREQIESGAARLAAKTLNGWEIDHLRRLAMAVEKSGPSGDRKARYESSYKFHDFLISRCGNPLLLEVWKTQRLMPVQPRSRKLDERISAEVDRDSFDECNYMAVVDAIAAHDPDRAETLMRQRLRAVTESIRRIVMEECEHDVRIGIPSTKAGTDVVSNSLTAS